MKNLALPIGVFVLALIAGVALMLVPAKQEPVAVPTTTTYKDRVVVNLGAGASVSSPLVLTGTARGWYFEASFPIEVLDASGTRIASGPAQAQSDWMTSEPVAFSITLTFPQQPSGSTGAVVLHKDNPSDMREFDDSFSIPVVFK